VYNIWLTVYGTQPSGGLWVLSIRTDASSLGVANASEIIRKEVQGLLLHTHTTQRTGRLG